MNKNRTAAAHTIDIHIGLLIKQLRNDARMSQADLGDLINRSQQQVERYESGKGGVGAEVLWGMARIFGVPFEHFYAGVPGKPNGFPLQSFGFFQADEFPENADPKEAQKLVKTFMRIPKPVRSKLLKLCQAIAEAGI